MYATNQQNSSNSNRLPKKKKNVKQTPKDVGNINETKTTLIGMKFNNVLFFACDAQTSGSYFGNVVTRDTVKIFSTDWRVPNQFVTMGAGHVQSYEYVLGTSQSRIWTNFPTSGYSTMSIIRSASTECCYNAPNIWAFLTGGLHSDGLQMYALYQIPGRACDMVEGDWFAEGSGSRFLERPSAEKWFELENASRDEKESYIWEMMVHAISNDWGSGGDFYIWSIDENGIVVKKGFRPRIPTDPSSRHYDQIHFPF